MAVVLSIVQTLILVAGLALVGQFVVAAFNWQRREQNVIYQLFRTITQPVVAALRWVTPRLVLDQHMPIVAFLVLCFAYFAVGFWHRDVCLADLAQAGCTKWAAARGAAP